MHIIKCGESESKMTVDACGGPLLTQVLNSGPQMLHDFITANREQIIERARQRVRERTAPKSIEAKLHYGIPLFLSQLVAALGVTASARELRLVGEPKAHTQIYDSAALHGHELLRSGFTLGQVVHGYGDVRQIVTTLASESNTAISPQDFHVFNLCLDEAIAGAVTAFAQQREQDLTEEGLERVGVLVHELRNLLHTAVLSFDVIRSGAAPPGGSTGTVHARSLAGLCSLAERSLAEVRLGVGKSRFERVLLAHFIEEVQGAAAMEAEGYGLHFTVDSVDVDADLAIDVDRQLLASALSNLLQNAFKYSRVDGSVVLRTRTTADRVLIEVGDACGGLPAGKAEELFRPFARGSSEQNVGLGLGLSIALRAIQANSGFLRVRDIPGQGCVFTVDLPREPTPPANLFHVLPDGAHGSAEGSDHQPGRGAHSREARTLGLDSPSLRRGR